MSPEAFGDTPTFRDMKIDDVRAGHRDMPRLDEDGRAWIDLSAPTCDATDRADGFTLTVERMAGGWHLDVKPGERDARGISAGWCLTLPAPTGERRESSDDFDEATDLPVWEIPNSSVAGSARQCRITADFLFALVAEHRCVLPLFMVAALGIELGLKGLNSKSMYHQEQALESVGGYLITAEAREKGHSLLNLLDAIDDQFWFALDEAYSANPAIKGKATLREALAAHDDLFVHARYPFEDGKTLDVRSIGGLVKLVDLIDDHISKMPVRSFFQARPSPNDAGGGGFQGGAWT